MLLRLPFVRICFLYDCLSELSLSQKRFRTATCQPNDLAKFNDSKTDVLQSDEASSLSEPGSIADIASDSKASTDQLNIEASTAVTAQPVNEKTRQTSAKTGRIGRRTVSKVGLASIGLNQIAPSDPVVNSLIWSDSDAEQALALLNNTSKGKFSLCQR